MPKSACKQAISLWRAYAERQKSSAPLVENLKAWLTKEPAKLSSKNPVAKAIDYSLKRWPAMTLFLADGRVCLSNNAAERALRGVAMTESLCSPYSSV